MKRLSTTSSIFLILSLPLAACDVSEDPPENDEEGEEQQEEEGLEGAAFARATAAQRQTAVAVALGLPQTDAIFSVFVADLEGLDDEKCPGRAESTEAGQVVVTFTGGCTSSSGTTYDGSATTRNAALLSQVFSETLVVEKDTEITFNSFTTKSGSHTIEADGTVWQSSPMPEAAYESKATLSVAWSGNKIAFDSGSKCTQAGGPCTFNEGASGSVEGLGSFSLRGTITLRDGELSGKATIEGADTLVADFDARKAGCGAVTIDGKESDDICFDIGKGGSEPSPIDIELAGLECLNPEVLNMTAVTNGPVDNILVELATTDMSIIEFHTLELVSESDESATWERNLDIVLDEATTEVSTLLDCATAEFRFTAFAADGSSACSSSPGLPCDPGL